MRYDISKQLKQLGKLEQGFLAGLATALLALGVTVLTVGAARRVRARALVLGRRSTMGIDSIPPRQVELAAQPQPEANATESPRLESEMTDVMLPSQRW